MDCALYFPYIRVPESPWFTQVLLYWDQAATIFPPSLTDDISARSRFMQDLGDAGLLRLLDPDDGLSQVDYRAFVDGFMALVEQHPLASAGTSQTRIHAEKMSYEIFHRLADRGLAAEPTDAPWWWLIDTPVADLYLTYLASVISAAHRGMVPVTDTSAALRTLGDPGSGFAERLSVIRYEVITNALPAPRAVVSGRDLVTFKEKHAESLRRCRVHLDNEIAELATIDDDELRRIRMAAITQEISDDVARLGEAMRKRRWPRIGLVGFGGLAAAALGSAAGLVGGGSPLELGLAAGSGILSTGIAGSALWDQLRQERFDPRAPLAYAALAGALDARAVTG